MAGHQRRGEQAHQKPKRESSRRPQREQQKPHRKRRSKSTTVHVIELDDPSPSPPPYVPPAPTPTKAVPIRPQSPLRPPSPVESELIIVGPDGVDLGDIPASELKYNGGSFSINSWDCFQKKSGEFITPNGRLRMPEPKLVETFKGVSSLRMDMDFLRD